MGFDNADFVLSRLRASFLSITPRRVCYIWKQYASPLNATRAHTSHLYILGFISKAVSWEGASVTVAKLLMRL